MSFYNHDGVVVDDGMHYSIRMIMRRGRCGVLAPCRYSHFLQIAPSEMENDPPIARSVSDHFKGAIIP